MVSAPSHAVTKQLVKAILEKADHYEWTLQGLGMLRLKMTDTVRLHVWNTEFAMPDVSRIHDHPLDFTSLIVAGVLRNVRYRLDPAGEEFCGLVVQCGVGGGTVQEEAAVRLRAEPAEMYREGDLYHQLGHELHDSQPESGTVTLLERVPRDIEDHAHIYWPAGKAFVSAEPRQATNGEVRRIVDSSLQKWFAG